MRQWVPLNSSMHAVCGSTEHTMIIMLAVIAIILYPIGVTGITAYLLYLERDALHNELETKGSAALTFLSREYKPHFFFWELLEISRKLILVGFMVLIGQGTITQLLIGLLIAFVRRVLILILIHWHPCGFHLPLRLLKMQFAARCAGVSSRASELAAVSRSRR